MLITITDGRSATVLDLDTMKTASVTMPYHSLRYHVYDSDLNRTTKKFSTGDPDLQDAIMSAAIKAQGGPLNLRNSWVRNIIRRKELAYDAYREWAMVRRDLASVFGPENVDIYATSKRYIYYVSDGSMKSTPDNIGSKFGMPLIYEGYALATVFDIKGGHILSPSENVVHWLTNPMWDRFHTKKRRSPRPFPWPTGFVCSYWCQREGYDTYGKGGGIRLASMSQGQTVSGWALVSLRQFWAQRQGKTDIFKWLGETFDPGQDSRTRTKAKSVTAFGMNAAGAPLGMIGLICPYCNRLLKAPYGYCSYCGLTMSIKKIEFKSGPEMCRVCGKSTKKCSEHISVVSVTTEMHNEQKQYLEGIQS